MVHTLIGSTAMEFINVVEVSHGGLACLRINVSLPERSFLCFIWANFELVDFALRTPSQYGRSAISVTLLHVDNTR